MASKDKAPDGLPFPNPRVAVDTAEQLPYAMGHVPVRWSQTGERGPVHHGVVDNDSLICTMLDGPWECERANLNEGDYQLLDASGAPIDAACVIERKSMTDLRGSLSKGRERLIAEMARMSPWATPVVIVEAPIEVLLGSRSGLVLLLDAVRAFLVETARDWMGAETDRTLITEWVEAIGGALGHEREDVQRPGRVTVQSLLGTTLSIIVDHRIPVLFLPSRAWAEYAAAWVLRRSWRRWLIDHPEGLAAERARLAAKVATVTTGVVGTAPAVQLAPLGGMTTDTGDYARRKRAARDFEGVGR